MAESEIGRGGKHEVCARLSVVETDACMPRRFILLTDSTQIHIVFTPNDLLAMCKKFILHQCLQLLGINTALLINSIYDRAYSNQCCFLWFFNYTYSYRFCFFFIYRWSCSLSFFGSYYCQIFYFNFFSVTVQLVYSFLEQFSKLISYPQWENVKH